MNLNELAKRITLAEGKKLSISIAQVKEVLGILSDVVYACWNGAEDFNLFMALLKNGNKRAKNRKLHLRKKA